jgi:biotin-dependent carboxylase-like uncharacterized protein
VRDEGVSSVVVRRPGLLTTVQDLGRPGLGRFGVSPSGAMDPLALRVANRLVGNPDGAPALEITAIGPELGFECDTTFALAGAHLSPTLGGQPIEVWRSYRAAAGDVLAFGPRRQGARCYLAVAGGFTVTPVLGSTATDLESGLGGIDGKPLHAGQRLIVGAAHAQPERYVRVALLRSWSDPFALRFLPNPEAPLGTEILERLCAATFHLSPRSNRMGYRLDGPALAAPTGGDMISEPIPPGTVQLPAGGQPILLMADRQTVGGYPRLGSVIAADLPKAGQLWLGHAVRFVLVSAEEAHAALAAQCAALRQAVTP